MSNEHTYHHPDHLQFADDMAEADLDVRHYRGRFYWAGPAVVVDDLQDALGATRVHCQWEQMGIGWVVYPRAYDHDVHEGLDGDANCSARKAPIGRATPNAC